MNKYIINDGWLKMGDVKLHLELARDHSTTKGGGLWKVDNENKIVYLYGVSTDYGVAKKEDIKTVIESGGIPIGLIEFKIKWSYEINFDKIAEWEDIV